MRGNMGVLSSCAGRIIFTVICYLEVMASNLQPLLLQEPCSLMHS
jgi:hypothetical protein